MKVGLYFGTYNPIHIGHLAIANYMVEFTDLDQVWFVVSPQSPHKIKSNLLDDYQRLEMVNLAIEEDVRFRASNIEFKLPKPSYTVDTLAYLKEDFPTHEFTLIMGSDNLKYLHKWKNPEVIIENYRILVYPRPDFIKEKYEASNFVKIVDAPLMEISSSFIRKAIKQGKDIRHFIPSKAWKYLDEMNFYK
ncbi:nicotinate (nicotinamide) nucleotide adenylyltransferase [Sunxiuqinia sp. A32]|uniref:nicotinate (nicotinamide) nucleotide adenylyltransferase n=1 Tax=Sunxiuqinia sp. A32 TaxID=3461496 RepID=UPI004045FDF7